MSLPGGTAPRLRPWIGTAAALFGSLTLLVLPEPARETTAAMLERSLFAPFRWAVGWGEGSLALRRELHELLTERTLVHLEQDRVLEIEQENQRLRTLLGFQQRVEQELVSAVVVTRDRGRLGDVLLVELAPGTAIPEGAPAVVPEGLIGWAATGGAGRIRVACLTNREVTLSVLDQRTRDEGLLSWIPPSFGQLELHDVPAQADWNIGDRVITSGLGTVFPRGLLVGWVIGSEPDAAGRGKRVFVRPAASPAQTEELFFLVGGGAEEGATELYPIDPVGSEGDPGFPEVRLPSTDPSVIPAP